MKIKSEKVKVISKTQEEKMSTRTGKTYTDRQIIFEEQDGTIITTRLNNEAVYNKAQENKSYSLIYYISPNGMISLNNLGE